MFSWIKKILKRLFVLFLWVAVLGVIGLSLFFISIIRTLPDPETIIIRTVKESTKIYDKTGEVLLYDIHGDEERTIVEWDNISPYVRSAVLAAEDANFYSHKGIDLKGIARAIVRNIQSGDIRGQGGSTITQQLIGNALVGREKTYRRKLQELILSIEIERRFSKDEILWMYLNQIPFGSTLYGIESASQAFFGKSSTDLLPAESAAIAALIQAPTYYSPYGKHYKELMSRKDMVLSRMYELDFINEDEYIESSNKTLEFRKNVTEISAPHFVIMIREYLNSTYGKEVVEGKGFKIISTLDANLQSKAERLVEKYAEINKKQYNASNTALVSLDPQTGHISALVGSADYFDIENEGNFNIATALRQPGSAFKPFAYAAAFQSGYPDYTIIFDTKTEFNFLCSPNGLQTKDKHGLDCYHPRNYDNYYRGPVSMRQALAQSLNVPSVKILYLAGINNVINLASKMGITTLKDPSRFGLSLVLGGAEVRLIDITSAYGVFANDGIKNSWTLIKSVELNDGTILEQWDDQSKRVLSSQVARIISDVMSDNNARAPVFGYNSPLFIQGRQVAAKTGTTQNSRDAWVIGYTPSLVVGVWSGNNNNTSMTKNSAGVNVSGPLWKEFMISALENRPYESFKQPNPVIIDKVMLNGRWQYKRNDNTGTEVHSILFYVYRENPIGSIPFNSYQDPQFANWESSVQSYFR